MFKARWEWDWLYQEGQNDCSLYFALTEWNQSDNLKIYLMPAVCPSFPKTPHPSVQRASSAFPTPTFPPHPFSLASPRSVLRMRGDIINTWIRLVATSHRACTKAHKRTSPKSWWAVLKGDNISNGPSSAWPHRYFHNKCAQIICYNTCFLSTWWLSL